MTMRKTTDLLNGYPKGPDDPTEGQYRLRIYEDQGKEPVIVVTDATPEAPHRAWISGHAPQLVSTITRAHLPSARKVQWLNSYSAQNVKDSLFEQTRFEMLADGQAVYRQHFRSAESPAIQPQSKILSDSDAAALLGQPLD
jgi:hypothetical protein